MTGEHHTLATTRRGLIAAAGTAALAGCSGLPLTGGGESSVKLDAAALQAVGRRPRPNYPETVPVAIEDAHLRAGADRARTLLSAAPDPLGRDEIPNGAIRKELRSMRQSATDALGDARSAASALERMQSLRRARDGAGGIAAGWRFVEGEVTREALLEDAAALGDDVDALVSRVEYVGGDPVRAAAVYVVLERGLQRATHYAAVDRERVEATRANPVSVGELGGDLERGRALAEDVGHLYDRYAADVDAESGVRPTLDAAAGSLLDALEGERESLPDFDPEAPADSLGREVGETPAVWALRRIHDEATEREVGQRDVDAGRPAAAVVAAQRALAHVGAFTGLHERVAGGETYAVASADDVAAIRAEAVEAMEAAAEAVDDPHLAGHLLATLPYWFDRGDHELTDVREGVEVDWVVRDVAGYVVAAALARALPAASSRVVTALRDAA